MISQAIILEIPNLGGYQMSETKKIFSPYGNEYVKYVNKSEVSIYVFGGWRNYNIDYLYSITFD